MLEQKTDFETFALSKLISLLKQYQKGNLHEKENLLIKNQFCQSKSHNVYHELVSIPHHERKLAKNLNRKTNGPMKFCLY